MDKKRRKLIERLEELDVECLPVDWQNYMRELIDECIEELGE